MSTRMKSDQEVIEIIKAYRPKNPEASLKRMFKAAGIGEKRLKDMIARNLIDPPVPVKPGMAWRSMKI